ncbi:YoaK family protein [Streptomyces sp. H10-C2]|uniref:YoaK family protein n=1 Tax=unclassified Streptomyces TaxID=2593676 RepID=UPI0024BB1347|nr:MULTISPECIES: YoaK family protein [unclassified Streptomyces]MDJ0343386.1 YoaK family protein [Streptomyces sp. PH10-H1]MDJ0371803.1 YoaK family protein [Streptomyces sp. H10-C2]
MITALRDAWNTLVPDLDGRHGPLPRLLLALTVVTGFVDAFSYLVLGHVFVANMTGNVVFIAFSLAGAAGFSLTASLVFLLSFAAGALIGGRVANRFPDHRGRLLLAATVLEAVLVLAACLTCELSADPSTSPTRYLLIVLLGWAMGGQNAAVRRLAVPDLNTTVLTMTVTGIAADGRLAGGTASKIGTRGLSVAAMFLGALAGAILIRHTAVSLPLLIAGLTLAGTAAVMSGHAHSTRPWTA